MQLGDELRDRGQRLLEEHRDVLDRQPLDGDPIAVRPIGHRHPGPERTRAARRSPAPRSPRARTGRRGTPAGRCRAGPRRHPRAASPDRRPRRPGHAHRRPTPSRRRPSAGSPCAAASSSAVRPVGAGVADGAEQPELQPDVDEPRAVEPAEAAARSSKRSSIDIGGIVTCDRPDRAAASAAATARSATHRARCNGRRPRAVFRMVMDDHRAHRVAWPRDLDGTFETLVHGACRPVLLDRAPHPRRPTRRRGGRAGRARAGLSRARELRAPADP